MTSPSKPEPLEGYWWVCRCGRKLYEHSRVGGKYVCLRSRIGADGELEWETHPFESETLPALGYDPEHGLVRYDAP
jgi:hypothetical protein